MAYYLTIKEKTGYKLLNITELEEFRRISKYKDNAYSLEEIDIFTSKFNNELILKRKLYTAGIITIEDITKEISIRRKHKNEFIKVMYDLVYQYNKRFIDDYYLRSKLLELQNDPVFLNKLLNHYRNNYKQEHQAKIRAILGGYQDTDISMYEALSSFYKDEIYEIEPSTGVVTIKYKSFHDLAMFIYNYIIKRGQSELDIQKIELMRIEELESLKQSLEPTPIYVKKKTKKPKQELEGQISFFNQCN